MVERRKPVVTELALVDTLERLVVMINELRADVDLRVQITTDETELVELTFSGTPDAGVFLQRKVRDERQLVLPVATTIFAGRDGQSSRPPASACAGHRLCRYTVRANSIDTPSDSHKGHYVIPISRALPGANSHRMFELWPQ